MPTLPISYETINRGAVADDNTGDDPRTWAGKTNNNVVKLFETPTLPYVVVTASKTLGLADIGVRQWVNDPDPVTLTIPAAATTAFAVGTMIPGARLGAGSVTLTAAAGVSLNGITAGSTTVQAQYAAFTLEKIGADAWLVTGLVADVA